MANFNLAIAANPARKSATRRTETVAAAPTSAQARADKEMHKEIGDRARTTYDLSSMTRFNRSMTRDEIIAKVMGKKVEEIFSL